MQRGSFWMQGERRQHPPLKGRHTSDVVIIGGGLAGLTCALWLSRAGLRVTLAEAERLGSGASAHCAGIVSLSGGMQYAYTEAKRGSHAAQACAHTQQSALRAIRELPGTQAFDWHEADFFLTADTRAGSAMLEEEKRAMEQAGVEASLESAAHAPFSALRALRIRRMGMLNPARYLEFLAEHAADMGVRIHEQSRVTALETNAVYTERGSVQAPYIVVATGYPIINTPGWYFLRLEQRENRLVPMVGEGHFSGIYATIDGRYSLRPLGGGALMQVGGSYVGSRKNPPAPTGAAVRGMQAAGESFAGIEAYTPDGLPFIGPYGSRTPNLFVAAGFNGRGVLGSMVAAQAISARILGLPSEGYEIYSGQRSIGEMHMPVSIGARYAGEWMRRPSGPRCPHMGCRLRYNARSRLWECPCHGSRFDDIGHVLNAPSVHDAILKDRR